MVGAEQARRQFLEVRVVTRVPSAHAAARAAVCWQGPTRKAPPVLRPAGDHKPLRLADALCMAPFMRCQAGAMKQQSLLSRYTIWPAASPGTPTCVPCPCGTSLLPAGALGPRCRPPPLLPPLQLP